ncbi:MAG: LysR family transcriptional regulator [Bacteroidales bacterium]|nr:LysR family transcriptional regulator [Bacteroidales bacterium]
MTFQQLEYIIAVDKSRHFVNAAAALGVTQSTLSMAISKLEQEIDVTIFDRSKHPIEPTPMGKRIIQQASVILHNSSQLLSMVQSERDQVQGQLLIGMTPSVAPVLFPRFGRFIKASAPHLQAHIFERSSAQLISALQRSELDMIIINNSELKDSSLLEISLWTERFMVYAADGHALRNRENLRVEELLDGNIWTLRSFHDQYPQLTEVTHQDTMRQTFLETGSLQTLISAVDINGGFTLLPESYAACMTPQQRQGLHPVSSGKFFRTMSLVIRQDYMREGMLNVVIGAVKQIIPRQLLTPRIANYDRVKI